MAYVTIGVPSHGWNLGFVTNRIKALRTALDDRARHRRQLRAVEAELHQDSTSELTELGISPADIRHIAREPAQYSREEEFRSALDKYVAGYRKHRPMSGPRLPS